MDEYNIEQSDVTTDIEALYWISKIWFENSDRTKDEKENMTKIVLDYLATNIIEQVT